MLWPQETHLWLEFSLKAAKKLVHEQHLDSLDYLWVLRQEW